jgi:hypothetical protein
LSDVSGSATSNEGRESGRTPGEAPDDAREVDDRQDAAIRWRKRLDARMASKKRTRI